MKGAKGKKVYITTVLFIFLTLILISIPTTIASDNITISFLPHYNLPPFKAINPYPSNNSKNVATSVTLRVDIFDNTSDFVDVYFYNAYDDSLIGVDYNVSGNWSTALTVWSGLYKGSSYRWYVEVNDSEYINTSEVWKFTTQSAYTPPPLPPPAPTPRQPPIANITGPIKGYVKENLIFSANKSYDLDGHIVGYRWDFNNDGLFDTDWQESVIVLYNYSVVGNYTIRLQVMDNDNSTSTTYHYIQIIKLEPPLELPVPKINRLNYYGDLNENISFLSILSYDPDGLIINYTWDFGDNNRSFLKNPVHSYAKPGNYTVILKITDDDNLSNYIIAKAIIRDNYLEETEEDKDVIAFNLLVISTIVILIPIVALIFWFKIFNLIVERKAIKKEKNLRKDIDKIISDFEQRFNKK